MNNHKHNFDPNLQHEPRCKCRMMQYSIPHAKELEKEIKRLQDVIQEVNRLAYLYMYDPYDLEEKLFPLLEKELEPKTN